MKFGLILIFQNSANIQNKERLDKEAQSNPMASNLDSPSLYISILVKQLVLSFYLYPVFEYFILGRQLDVSH